MARVALQLHTLAILLVLLFLSHLSLATLGPLCLSQFALANKACIALPVEEVSRNSSQVKLQEEDKYDDDEHEHEHHHGHRHGHGHEHEHHHGHRHGHGHEPGHSHKHGHRSRHGEEPRAYKDCCRWLAQVDEACVCEVLLRMPPFFIEAEHTYIIKVGNACKHEYNCRGI